jgi:SAM-dependent methyltransferase
MTTGIPTVSETECPVCDEPRLVPVVERSHVPVHQNLVFTTPEAAIAASLGDLSIVACETCGFVFNRLYDANLLSYSQQYDNTQLSSAVFQDHVRALVDRLLEGRQLRNAHIVEVGCGKGAFIRALVADVSANNTGVGFDPSYVGADVDLDGQLRFERRFFDSTCLTDSADAAISRHVIEHVPDPVDFIRTMAAALEGKPGGRLFLETPCVAWIFREQAVWDFFYEHCSYFTARSLTMACARAGLQVDEVRHVFGGQYLWLEASKAQRQPGELDAGAIPELARRFAETNLAESDRVRRLVRELAQRHRLAVWGAAAKGVTFANLTDPDRRYVDCLVDVNPAKQGGYVGGTGHPIVAPDALSARGVTYALVMNPIYLQEIQAHVRSLQLSFEVVSVDAG